MTRNITEVALDDCSYFTGDIVWENPDYIRRALESAPDRQTARRQVRDALSGKAMRIIELGSKSEVVYNFAAYGYASWVQGYLDDDVEKIVDGCFVEPGRGSGSVRARSKAPARKAPAKKPASGRR